jgi:hypothetical protein
MDRLLDGFRGSPMASEWVPLECRLETVSEAGDVLVPTDFPSLHFAGNAVSDSVVQSAGDLLRQFAELLPLDCPDGRYFAVNVTNVLDALDSEKSECVYFPNSERIIRVARYALRGELIPTTGVFKISQQLRGAVLITEAAAQVLSDAGTGLSIQLAWEG